MNNLYPPFVINLDISHIEDYFPIFCPVCGVEIENGNSNKYCSHIVIDYTPDCEYIKKSLSPKKRLECWDAIQEILKNGAPEPLMIFSTWSYSLDGGEAYYTGISLKEWVDQGIEIT